MNALQTRAVVLLASGLTVSETAMQCRKSRRTVSRWLHDSVSFRAALDDAIRQKSEELRLRWRLTEVAAVETMEAGLRSTDLRARLYSLRAWMRRDEKSKDRSLRLLLADRLESKDSDLSRFFPEDDAIDLAEIDKFLADSRRRFPSAGGPALPDPAPNLALENLLRRQTATYER